MTKSLNRLQTIESSNRLIPLMNSTVKSGAKSDFKSVKLSPKKKNKIFIDPDVIELGYHKMAIIKSESMLRIRADKIGK